jgi:hypothetical protein
MSYSESGDRVRIELSREQFYRLLLALASSTGEARLRGDTVRFRRLLRLANAVNEGNPAWKPYEIPGDAV